MTKEDADYYRKAAAANGMTDPADFETLERYITEDDEDAVKGLIWSFAEEDDGE